MALGFASGLGLGVLLTSAGELNPVLTAGKSSSTGGGSSFAAGMSSDARFVAFLSHANNLVTNDSLNPWLDVFRRDMTNGTTTLVSVGIGGIGGGNDNSFGASVSSNGTVVVFESTASNLVPNDTNGFSDVVLRDLAEGTTRLVSSSTNGFIDQWVQCQWIVWSPAPFE